jgi:2-dehydro-3-deoxyphosphogluconate aldolase/(4S)-4-hydroxy-2-oxoglutarate aldolase
MCPRSEICARIERPGIIAVVRTERPEQVPPICEALIAGGVLAVEITLTVPRSIELIHETSKKFGGQSLVGAGSVLDAQSCLAAIDAGAQFVVSPITKLEIIAAAHAAGRPVMLGAYTPTEAQTAHEAGADYIKIFPADKLGPAYVKALRAPLPHLRIVPTGGVDLQTAGEFLKIGCAALGVGSSLLTPEILRTGNWPELTRLAKAFVEIGANVKREFRSRALNAT